MLGALTTALFCAGACGFGLLLFRKWMGALDPALRLGTAGLFGLGTLGTISLPILLLPSGASWGVFVVGVIGIAGLYGLVRERPRCALPRGAAALALPAVLLVAFCSLVMVLAPSDSFDWDSLAYHLAVPKLWLLAGQMQRISFIHHSNFPGVIDDLFVWGLRWGGESGAKAFSLLFALFGAFAVFGFGRQRYGATAGWWALLGYVAIPLVGWESGTGYIDIGNGLFVALGLLFGATFVSDPEDRSAALLGAVALGFAAASKYTGLQAILAVCLVQIAWFLAGRGGTARSVGLNGFRLPILGALIAVAIASPWYLKNVVNTGNPVYPFFYSIFKGKDWDAFSDQIYRHQQQTFGAGRPFAGEGEDYPQGPLQPARFGGAVLGLAYQPGRYTDPQPTKGGGFPFQSLGAVGLAAILFWAFSGRVRRFEGAYLGFLVVSLGMWFVLSEQSRYIVGLFIPACVLLGGAVACLRSGSLLAGATALQLCASLWVLTRYPDGASRFTEKLKVVIGGQTADEYRHRFIGFFDASQELNRTVGAGKVALYDEVFGFLLDVPYFWANPGHSTEMGYEQMTDSVGLIESFHRLGITKVYFNLGEAFGPGSDASRRWLQAASLEEPFVPYPDRAEQMKDPQSAYKVLLAEAVAAGRLIPAKQIRSAILFDVQPAAK